MTRSAGEKKKEAIEQQGYFKEPSIYLRSFSKYPLRIKAQTIDHLELIFEFSRFKNSYLPKVECRLE